MATAVVQHATPHVRRKKRKDTRRSLNMRVLPEIRSLIDRAAELTGKNITDFVLDAARQAAQEALLDRTVIQVSPQTHAQFVAILDNPQPNERLRRLMQTPSRWER